MTNCLRNCLLLSTLSLSEPKGKVYILHSRTRLKPVCPRLATMFDPFNMVSIRLFICSPLPKCPVLMVVQSNPLKKNAEHFSPLYRKLHSEISRIIHPTQLQFHTICSTLTLTQLTFHVYRAYKSGRPTSVLGVILIDYQLILTPPFLPQTRTNRLVFVESTQ